MLSPSRPSASSSATAALTIWSRLRVSRGMEPILAHRSSGRYRSDLNVVQVRGGAVMLEEFVAATATRFGIPGVAVGVWAQGRESFACHGVTSVDNPLPVDRDTMFVLGSVTKT